MSYKRKYSIFISSTYQDLIEERREILGVALENNFIPVGMEQFHAYPASQWDIITKMIDECDVYLLIIGGRYGSIDEGTGISFTEKEYDYAKSKGIPVLALLRKTENITQDKMDYDDDKFEKQRKLELFRNKVNNGGNTTDRFGNIDELKYVVSQALKNAKEVCGDNSGWIRISEIQSVIDEKVEEQNKQQALYKNKQDSAIESMQIMLSQLAVQLEEVKNNQISFTPVTKEDLNNLFLTDGDTLVINGVVDDK